MSLSMKWEQVDCLIEFLNASSDGSDYRCDVGGSFNYIKL